MKQIGQMKKQLISIILQQYTFIISGIFIIFFVSPVEIMAQGGLLITPRRVVFDGSKNIEQLNLANTGQDTASYLISFVQYRMGEDGNFEQITEPDSNQFFADDYLRLYPRKVTLAPNEAQLVKLQLKNYRKLADGEYRSHIYFRSAPDVNPLGEEDKVKDTTTISISLVPIFGISIAAIIKKGVSTTELSLSDLSFEMINDSTPSLNMTFNRSGNMSVYGDIEVDYISVDNVVAQIAIARGLAVYTPNTIRYFRINLNNNIDYSNGTIRVRYKTKSDLKNISIAEAELKL